MLQESDIKEARKRRRERIIIIITIAVVLALTFIESRLTEVEARLPLSDEVLIFGLVNINLILIILLIFLIVRNLVKLVFERRHGILGSKIRTKLVAAFISLSLIPTIVLFLVSIKFLSNSIDNWFNMKLVTALGSSLEVAQIYYQQYTDNALYYARSISETISREKLYDKNLSEDLTKFLAERQKIFKLGRIELSLDNRKEKVILKDPFNPDIITPKLSPKMQEDLFRGKEITAVQSVSGGDLVSGHVPLHSNYSPKEVMGVVSVGYFISKDIIERMDDISRASEQYKQLTLLKNPIKFSYMITLFIVMLLIVFSATWFGLFLAKGITVPIQDLAEATHEISGGNLDYHIDVLADDEIGVLVDSFNQMTADLKRSSDGLRQANIDLDQRRKYMETVLRNVSAGVISIDKDGVITTINRAAEEMLSIKVAKVLNKKYGHVLRPEHMEMVQELLKELQEQESDFLEKQAQLILEDKVLTILISTTILKDDNGTYLGMVIVFEDITQLQKAERVAAWREVARRIAHEIKNPLTPVKLSAERLQRKYGDNMKGDEGTIFRECTATIVNQVDVLKNLVNEFSKFARMPATNPAPNNLNEVIEHSILLFEEAHKEIHFSLIKGHSIPQVMIDAEQIKRVMVNLLDNSVTAVSSVKKGEIQIVTSYIRETQKARVEVKDNGCGIEPKDKMKLFEPYFSTKKSGTGLGLTIVSSIISDHKGTIGVKDNSPAGTIVFFDFPVA
ncbi:MAG: ATP-binding protein [Syntrophales bacterium]|jgi:two-component system nitrogen regulation sensor histidine kinase NtrY|nr:ATP-binding protein [Syntrophales bacterium]MDY0044695.1 ATP-binding protein [Syntrophales bacterium]